MSTSPAGPGDTITGGARVCELAVWSRDALPEWVERALRSQRGAAIRIGSPLRAVRDTLGAMSADASDIRSFTAAHRGTPILHVGFGTNDEESSLASSRSVVCTTEPWLRHPVRGGPRVHELPVPAFPHDGPFAQASEFIAQGAPPHLLHAASLAPGCCGSLLARLQDVALLLVQMVGLPERISAAGSVQRLHQPHDSQPDSSSRVLRLCEGTICASCSFGDGRTASLTASNRHWHWHRSAIASGPFGAIRVDDQQMEWRSVSNEVLETPAPAATGGAEIGADTLLLGALTQPAAAENTLAPLLIQKARAVLEAACLASLTGEAESPLALMELLAQE